MTLSNYAWHGKPSGDVYYNDGDDVDSSYGKSPDIYMGGSEGVMQVTDYGDIQFETWLHVSYGNFRAN